MAAVYPGAVPSLAKPILASLLVTAGPGGDAYGRWSLWARITDAPEIPVIHCGFFAVIGAG